MSNNFIVNNVELFIDDKQYSALELYSDLELQNLVNRILTFRLVNDRGSELVKHINEEQATLVIHTNKGQNKAKLSLKNASKELTAIALEIL